MILKLNLNKMSDKEGWMLIDGFDSLTYHYHHKDDVIGVRSNVRDYLRTTETLCSNAVVGSELKPASEIKILEDYYEIWLMKGEDTISQILAHGPIYILNDEGKTIERI